MPTLVASPPATLSVPAALLDNAEVGLLHFRPVYAPGGSTELVDLAYLRLNPAAQRLLRLPEVPTATFRKLHPQAEADFAFYHATFLAGTVRSCNLSYPSGWQARAQRHGNQLVVSLMANTPPLSELPAQAAATRLAASYSALARTQLAARQLAQERDVLHQVLAQTPTPICLLRGPEYRFEYVNPAFARLFAHRALEGLPAADVLPEALNQGFMALLDRVYETGETWLEAELPLPGPQPGGQRYFNFTYQAHLENGHPDRLSVFAYEVTEQVLARQQVQQLNHAFEARVAERTQQLQAAQRRAQEQEAFGQVLAQTPALVAVLRGPEYRLAYANHALEQLFGGRPLLGQPLAEALPELATPDLLGLLNGLPHSGQTHVATEVSLALAQGSPPARVVHLHLTGQPHHEAGQPVGISLFGFEVGEPGRARRQPHAGLPQLQRLFEQAPMALALLAGPTHVVEVATPAMCALWGCTQAQVLGQPLAAVLPELATPAFEQELAEVRRTGVAFVAQERAVHRWRQGQPETRYLYLVCQPFTDAQGQLTAVSVVAVDVSARVAGQRQLARANKDLRATNQQLTRTNVALDNFIDVAAHNLKVPVATIENLLLLLRQQLPTEVRHAGLVPQVLALMHDAINRFQLAIAQLTDPTQLQPAPGETSR